MAGCPALGSRLFALGDSKRRIEAIYAYMRLDPFYTYLASYVLELAQHYGLEQYPQVLSLLLRQVLDRFGRIGRLGELRVYLFSFANGGRGNLTDIQHLRDDQWAPRVSSTDG